MMCLQPLRSFRKPVTKSNFSFVILKNEITKEKNPDQYKTPSMLYSSLSMISLPDRRLSRKAYFFSHGKLFHLTSKLFLFPKVITLRHEYSLMHDKMKLVYPEDYITSIQLLSWERAQLLYCGSYVLSDSRVIHLDKCVSFILLS